MSANQAKLPVASMCDTLSVSKSGYYDWRDRAPSKRAQANTALTAQIKAAHALSDATYGMPRIRAELANQGVVASRKRIAHLMRAAKVAGVSRRRAWCVTTERNKRDWSYPVYTESPEIFRARNDCAPRLWAECGVWRSGTSSSFLGAIFTVF